MRSSNSRICACAWRGSRTLRRRACLLDRMESIVREETARTKLSLLAAARDSRLGFQYEQDYVYTPYSLREKLGVLRETEKLLTKRREK